MATKKASLDEAAFPVKIGKANNVYINALTYLFNLVGGSLLFKLKIKRLKEEMETKVFIETPSVREAASVLNLALSAQKRAARDARKPLEEMVGETEAVNEAKAKFDSVCNEIFEKEILLNSSKIPLSLLPDETVLARPYYENFVDPVTKNTVNKQGDYITLVATIWDDLIDENA